MVKDDKAEALEDAGLFRRAAARWLCVMQKCQTERQRDYVLIRRKQCIEKVKSKSGPEVDSFRGLDAAATRLQKEMGIHKPGGVAFRQRKQD